MPTWIIHLATAKDLLKNINVKDENSFLVGNLIPDAQRYVVKDFSIYVPYNITHYALEKSIDGQREILPDINRFLYNYKNNLENPMVLGYLTHLLTDYYWNRCTYFRYTIRDNNGNCIGVKLNNGTKLKCDVRKRADIKHNDFDIFKNQIILSGRYLLPKYDDKLLLDLKNIKELPYIKEDINKIINFVKKEKYVKNLNNYKMFNEKQIEIDYKQSIKFVLDYLLSNTLVEKK